MTPTIRGRATPPENRRRPLSRRAGRRRLSSMATSLSADQVRRLCLRAQRLDPRPAAAGVAQVVREVCGVQAQDPAAAALAVRARGAGLTAAGVERARVEERSVVRTWCMRGTLHLVATEDLGWL